MSFEVKEGDRKGSQSQRCYAAGLKVGGVVSVSQRMQLGSGS